MKALFYLGQADGCAVSYFWSSWSYVSRARQWGGRYTLMGGASANETSESGLRYLLAQCPNHAPAHDNLAIILENKGNFEEARSLCIRTLAADSSVIAPYAGLGEVCQTDGSR